MSGPVSPGRCHGPADAHRHHPQPARAARPGGGASSSSWSAEFDAEIWVERNGTEVGGQSIMGLMMLAAGPGTDIAIAAAGRQGAEALAALVSLVERGFDED